MSEESFKPEDLVREQKKARQAAAELIRAASGGAAAVEAKLAELRNRGIKIRWKSG